MNYQLFHGDCLDFMRTMDAGSVGAIITDPPYGININKSHRLSTSRGFGGQTWDEVRPYDTVKKIIELFSGKPIVIWGGNYFSSVLPDSRGWLIWDKVNDGRDFGEAELAWTNQNRVIRRYKKFPVKMDGGKVHPTQKPIEVMRWCMEYAKIPEGVTVFDPFMGSGSVGVACAQTGRNFIGCEIDDTYFEIASRRIREATAQPTLEGVA